MNVLLLNYISSPSILSSNPGPPPGGLAHGHPPGTANQNLTPIPNSPPKRPQDKWSTSGPLPINRHKDKNILFLWGLLFCCRSSVALCLAMSVVQYFSVKTQARTSPPWLRYKQRWLCLLTRQLWGFTRCVWQTWHPTRTQQLYSANMNIVDIIIMFLTDAFTHTLFYVSNGHAFPRPVRSVRRKACCDGNIKI